MGSRDFYPRMPAAGWDRPRPPPPRYYDDVPPPPPPPPHREYYNDYDYDYDPPPPPPPPPRDNRPYGGGYGDYLDGPPRGRGYSMERGRGERSNDRGRGQDWNRGGSSSRGRGHGHERGRGQDRGRGRGNVGAARGKAYDGGYNKDQKKPANNSVNVVKSGSVGTGKPSWLNQPSKSTAAKMENSASPSKPAWMNKPSTTQSSTATSVATSMAKPAWMNQSSTQTSATQSSTATIAATSMTKPAWMNQPNTQTSATQSSTPTRDVTSMTMPPWMNQPNTQTSAAQSSTATSMAKPAWLSAQSTMTSNSNGTTVITTSNTQTGNTLTKPAWMNQEDSKPKPGWLSNAMGQTANHSFMPKPIKSSAGVSVPARGNIVKAYTASMTNHKKPVTNQKALAINQKATEAQGNATKVSAPGEASFISFKNSLQEFNQKKGFPVPSYTCRKGQLGPIASVEVAGQTFHSSGIHRERKEAEQSAALEALKGLGLFPASTPFNCKVPVKRPATGSVDTIAKKLKGVAGTVNLPNMPYKSQLNEFCQKFHLPIPTYQTVREPGGFVSTMTYNAKVFQSTSPQQTKKAAEQNVAQFVLSKVNQAPPPPDSSGMRALQKVVHVTAQKQPDGTATIISSTMNQSRAIPVESIKDLIVPEGGLVVSYKNRLQEYCQKSMKPMPVYDTVKPGASFECNVLVDGATYTARGCKTKKGSEQSAARVALQCLGELRE